MLALALALLGTVWPGLQDSRPSPSATRIEWPADQPKPDLAGFWKTDCDDGFGVKIEHAGGDLYSLSFCGPGGCFAPGAWRPNSPIFGDKAYGVLGADAIQLPFGEGFDTYHRCSTQVPEFHSPVRSKTIAPAKGPARKPQPEAVAVAGLLGGNTLVPLGQFVGGQWVRTWPAPDEQLERKLKRMAEIPRAWFPSPGGLPREWFLWVQDGSGIPVRVLGPKLADAHCEGVWGLSTRLLATGHETTVIATTVQAGVRPFGRSTVGAATDQHFRSFLRDQFDKAATAAIRSGRKDADTVLSHQPDCEPVYELNCVGTGHEQDGELCAFEASRRLGTKPSQDDPNCEEIVVVQGWYKSSADTFTLLQVSGLLTDCDFKEFRSSTPLVLIEVGGRSFVVLREHGYEDESFAVVEIRGDELQEALKVPGGGC